MTVRVRIGPSPTGEPHVGTAYIALFNLAFTRKNGGKFILRIEDTDQERSRPEWEREIIAGLKWLGLDWDEGPDKGGPYGPYRQSERTLIYQEHARTLLSNGHAYRCFCTKERLDTLREEQKKAKQNFGYDRHCRELDKATIDQHLADQTPFVVRLKMPIEGQTIVPDKLRGDVAFENTQIDDQVLLKSDGFPTYHLANVVDDHLMKITHVIRAEEWINSTPKHVVLYRAFGWQAPEFYHMPLLRNSDKSKISKRKNPVSILDYKQRGFLPEAVLNYLAMLGWSMADGREMFSVQDFIDNFSWDRISLGGPIFDIKKLSDLNGRYYREKMSEAELAKLIRDTLFREEQIAKIVPLIKKRIDTLEAFVPATSFFFSGDVEVNPAEMKPEGRTFKEVATIFDLLGNEIDRQYDFSPAALETLLRAFAEKNEWKTTELFMAIRVAVTGRTATPELFDTISVLGRALVRRRLRAAVELANKTKDEQPRQPKQPKEQKQPNKPEEPKQPKASE
jgi:glutamyl-tRNA synthetase